MPTIKIPRIKRVFPELFGYEIISVLPMSAPVGNKFSIPAVSFKTEKCPICEADFCPFDHSYLHGSIPYGKYVCIKCYHAIDKDKVLVRKIKIIIKLKQI